MEKKVELEQIFRQGAPLYKMLYLEADVVNPDTPDALSEKLNSLAESIKEKYTVPDINKRPGIAATRAAYKTFGKDPNRYRPSQEQMMRRILKGLGLYNVDALVDAGNFVSITTGCSLGIFDRNKISGDTLRLGIGIHDEPYEGIGRGSINIEGLPVIRDNIGGIGTPTSDNERTKVDSNTTRISLCMHFYDSSEWSAEKTLPLLTSLLEEFCNAKNIETLVID